MFVKYTMFYYSWSTHNVEVPILLGYTEFRMHCTSTSGCLYDPHLSKKLQDKLWTFNIFACTQSVFPCLMRQDKTRAASLLVSPILFRPDSSEDQIHRSQCLYLLCVLTFLSFLVSKVPTHAWLETLTCINRKSSITQFSKFIPTIMYPVKKRCFFFSLKWSYFPMTDFIARQ